MKLLNIIFIIFLVILLCYMSSSNIYNFNDINNINRINRINRINQKHCKDHKNNIDFINGYWTSDNDFAKMSEIDEMILNIDMNNKKGFLIIIIENKIVSNNEFDILFNKNHDEIEFISDNINFIWNEKKFNFDISLNKGSLVLYDEGTIYASLYKDNKLSAIIN